MAISVGTLSVNAQGYTQSNPLEYAAIYSGETLLDSQIVK